LDNVAKKQHYKFKYLLAIRARTKAKPNNKIGATITHTNAIKMLIIKKIHKLKMQLFLH
jgi:hypothetical protein